MAWTMGSWALASRVDPPRLAFSAPDTYSAQHHCHSLARCLPSRGKRGLIPGCAQHQTHQQHEQHCEVLLMGDWGPQACRAHTHLPSALSLCCTHLPGAWGLVQGGHSTNVCRFNKLHFLSHHHKFVCLISPCRLISSGNTTGLPGELRLIRSSLIPTPAPHP